MENPLGNQSFQWIHIPYPLVIMGLLAIGNLHFGSALHVLLRCSYVAINAILSLCVKTLTPENSSDLALFQIISLGNLLFFRKNGEYPVVLEQAKLIENSIAGNLVIQSLCLSPMH